MKTIHCKANAIQERDSNKSVTDRQVIKKCGLWLTNKFCWTSYLLFNKLLLYFTKAIVMHRQNKILFHQKNKNKIMNNLGNNFVELR